MEWTKALGKFKESLSFEVFRFGEKIKTPTSPSEVYIKRCNIYIKDPPPKDWDGVYVLTQK
jgi:adenylate cyclase